MGHFTNQVHKISTLKHLVHYISICIFTCVYFGCASPPSVRNVGDYLETVPISTEIDRTKDLLSAVGVSGMKNAELRIMAPPATASRVVDHILALDPNEVPVNLLRFYPENLLLQINSDDKYYRLEVREQVSFMSGELLLFVSPSNKYKGYWGWSSRQYSQDDAERLNASRKLFREPIIEVNQAVMRDREKSNIQGGTTYLVPALPLGMQPNSVKKLRSKENEKVTK